MAGKENIQAAEQAVSELLARLQDTLGESGGLEELLARMAALESRNAELEGEVRRLAREVVRLGTERLDLEKRTRKQFRQFHDRIGPSANFLSLPLVFRSEKGEYLGVSDRQRQHFALADFISLIETNARRTRAVDMRWKQPKRNTWCLELVENPEQPLLERHHRVSVRRQKTPKGNTVALLEQVNFNGQDMPVFFFYELFKEIGKGLG